MKPAWIAAAVAAAGVLPGPSVGAPPAAAPPFAFRETFARGLCTGTCPGAHWAIRQEVNGTVTVVPAPHRPGSALRARAAARGIGVAKAALVHRSGPIRVGTTLDVAFDIFIPRGTPINSMQLVDIECATCGEGGNPGVRLYLRRGRLRIDRSKIGIAHAWTDESAPALEHDRWHRITWQLRIGQGADGAARVLLDGRQVLAARGATITAGDGAYADRAQIGITANSNPVPATAFFADIAVRAR